MYLFIVGQVFNPLNTSVLPAVEPEAQVWGGVLFRAIHPQQAGWLEVVRSLFLTPSHSTYGPVSPLPGARAPAPRCCLSVAPGPGPCALAVRLGRALRQDLPGCCCRAALTPAFLLSACCRGEGSREEGHAVQARLGLGLQARLQEHPGRSKGPRSRLCGLSRAEQQERPHAPAPEACW